MPFELIRWTLAERYHWTLETIDALSMAELEEFFQIEDGRSRAGMSEPRPDNRPVGRRRR